MGFFSKLAGSMVKQRVTNTKTALELIIDDFKKYVFILKYVFLGFSVGTVVYSIIAGTGIIYINFALLGLLVGYAILDAVLKATEAKNASKAIRPIYAWLKIILNAGALASSLYTLYASTAGDKINAMSIVLSTLSIIMFVLKVLLEVCLDIFNKKWRLLKTGMILDAQEYPNTSGKIFGPFIGEFVEDQKLKQSDVDRIHNKQDDIL